MKKLSFIFLAFLGSTIVVLQAKDPIDDILDDMCNPDVLVDYFDNALFTLDAHHKSLLPSFQKYQEVAKRLDDTKKLYQDDKNLSKIDFLSARMHTYASKLYGEDLDEFTYEAYNNIENTFYAWQLLQQYRKCDQEFQHHDENSRRQVLGVMCQFAENVETEKEISLSAVKNAMSRLSDIKYEECAILPQRIKEFMATVVNLHSGYSLKCYNNELLGGKFSNQFILDATAYSAGFGCPEGMEDLENFILNQKNNIRKEQGNFDSLTRYINSRC